MAWSYEALVAELHERYNYANLYRGKLNTEISAAQFDWTAGDDHACLADVIDALEATRDAIGNLLAKSYYGYDGATYLLPTMLDTDMGCPFITEAPSPEITMSDIVNAMLSADFNELQNFIGIVDAYRVALWNNPFNAEFYAAIARGFTL